jgi:uncharacterized protein YabN with tetrapyrrole methylase and pyrophosphatase domain
MSTFPNSPYDIVIVGLGIAGVHQITREAEETIRRCNQTFVTDPAPGVADYLSGVSPHLVNLASWFKPGVHRLLIYRAIAAEIVTAAVERSPVCFATYGHPKVYSYPTVLIQRAAAILDLRTTVLPGISFIDTLLADLGIDPGFDGLQIYEATDLLIRRRPLQTDVGCVIAQATVVGASDECQALTNASNLDRLQKYLLAFYPPEHQAVIVVSKAHPLLEPILQRTPLGSLAANLAKVANGATLYLPPLQRRPIADEELARRMR